MSRLDLTTLVAGLSITGLGGVLLSDQLDGLHLGFGWVAPLVLAVIGAILLVSGLEGPRRRRR